jgi:hypothetical protein
MHAFFFLLELEFIYVFFIVQAKDVEHVIVCIWTLNTIKY